MRVQIDCDACAGDISLFRKLADMAWITTDARDLDGAEATARHLFPRLPVYRGGSHVAIHRCEGGPRIALIVEGHTVEVAP